MHIGAEEEEWGSVRWKKYEMACVRAREGERKQVHAHDRESECAIEREGVDGKEG